MKPQDQKLSDLVSAVESICPQLFDYWQATAIIESLGYTDRVIQQEFGFADALALGQYVYEQHHLSHTAKISFSKVSLYNKYKSEILTFVKQFSHSFVYVIPLLTLLALEYVKLGIQTQLLSPELASLLSLATMGSLISSGGFVQMISRRGYFYLGLGESNLSNRVCFSLLRLGMATSIILSFIGLWFGFYQDLFTDNYLIIATFYYLLVSLLWMLLAILALRVYWSTPVILIGLSILFIGLRVWGVGTLEAQILAMGVTLGAIVSLMSFAWLRRKKYKNQANREIKLPRLNALIYSLAPYFCYGTAYFSFIFADRIAAGTAINPALGLIFAINSEYQRRMDLALLNFLLLVPLVEYLGYKLIQYWFKQAKNPTSENTAAFSLTLRRRYWLINVVTVIVFEISVALTFSILKPVTWGLGETFQALIGCVGYLFFVLGLLNAIVLFSLNRAVAVIKALLPALAINFALSYILAHLIDVSYAAIGLVVGAGMFMLLSARKVLQAIKQPDYAYYLGGY